MKTLYFCLILCIFFVTNVLAADNGLANKPPMGWLAWARYTCETDCATYPDDCVSEKLFYRQADILAKEYLQYGYEFINIDDCWSELLRDNVTNELVPDRKRFPNGIKKLSDYVHGKGLKMGIYSDIGTKTCAGYPGHQDENDKGKFFFDTDAETFERWGIDHLKVDGCYSNTSDYSYSYPALGKALNKTGRPIVYSCEWPLYMIDNDEDKALDFGPIASSCNTFRNYHDVMFSWSSVTSIIDFYAKHQDKYVDVHGPNQWFDPDMIIVGNNGLSYKQMQAQMAIWCLWSAPLFISADLYKITPEEKRILTNKHLIDVNQDDEGILGLRVFKDKNFEIWLKPLSPVKIQRIDHRQYAVVYFNREDLGGARYFSKPIQDLIVGYGKSKRFNAFADLKSHSEQPIIYKVVDLFDDGNYVDRVRMNQNLTLKVDAAGAVRAVKLIPELDL